jgi:hypothetical protein
MRRRCVVNLFLFRFSLFSKQAKIVVKFKKRKSNANFFFGIIRIR